MKYLLLLLCMLSACHTPRTEECWTIDFSKKNFESTSLNLDDYVQEWKRVDLETQEDCLIDPTFSYYPTEDWIIAYNTNRILQFDYAGRFIRELSRLGEGPIEHGLVLDCTVDPSGKQLVLSEYGQTQRFKCFDLETGTCLPDIRNVSQKTIKNLLFTTDSTLLCFPSLGENKQVAYQQDLSGKWIQKPAGSIGDPSGAYSSIPVNAFQWHHDWYYKGLYEDTVFRVTDQVPYACFKVGEVAKHASKVEEQNSLLLNHAFTSAESSCLHRAEYEIQEVEKDCFEMKVVNFRAFMVNPERKQVQEIQSVSCLPVGKTFEQEELHLFFDFLSARNPNKLVLCLPSEQLGKDMDLNPVLFVGTVKPKLELIP